MSSSLKSRDAILLTVMTFPDYFKYKKVQFIRHNQPFHALILRIKCELNRADFLKKSCSMFNIGGEL